MNELEEKILSANEIVYEEGGLGDAVYIVTKGKVEVLRWVGKDRVRLAVLDTGSIFGESGVIRHTARSTTVRAITPVTLMVISKENFDAIFKRENPLALKLLRALCDRLAAVHKQILTHHLYSEAASYNKVSAIRLIAGSPEMQTLIGTEGIIIKNLPYRIGRHSRPEDKTTAAKADLMLQVSHGDEISPLHFAIENYDGRLIIRDLASHLGTLVADRRIGHFEEFSTADLRFGTTQIQAGGMDSPYRFQIVVEKSDEKNLS